MKPLHLLLFLQQHEFLAGIFCLDSNGAVRDKKRQNFWQTSSPRKRKNDILETFGLSDGDKETESNIYHASILKKTNSTTFKRIFKLKLIPN